MNIPMVQQIEYGCFDGQQEGKRVYVYEYEKKMLKK